MSGPFWTIAVNALFVVFSAGILYNRVISVENRVKRIEDFVDSVTKSKFN